MRNNQRKLKKAHGRIAEHDYVADSPAIRIVHSESMKL
jgi:hypothetical protein